MVESAIKGTRAPPHALAQFQHVALLLPPSADQSLIAVAAVPSETDAGYDPGRRRIALVALMVTENAKTWTKKNYRVAPRESKHPLSMAR